MIAAEGDCKTPIGAYAHRAADGSLHLTAFLAEPDGARYRSGERTLAWPANPGDAEALGRELGASLVG